MKANIFSAAGDAAQFDFGRHLYGAKSVIARAFEGIPAENATRGQIPRRENYILHTECIHRVASRGIQVYNFS